MTLSPLDPDPAPTSVSVEERALRLPAHCTTVTAEDLRVRLVLAADLDGAIEIDASAVESVGQATLQLLVAARAEADACGKGFAIIDPSSAFAERVARCRLAEAVGLQNAKDCS